MNIKNVHILHLFYINYTHFIKNFMKLNIILFIIKLINLSLAERMININNINTKNIYS